ncbi:TIM-barrel domain-containing protein [Thermophilibacter immobilis]|uniref:Uncharacterized protein n=1 Tax=Thermophilibacter immobilis TaxID=2779519 RepID=A0A7S7M8J3_9ACTN|nr:TIM-barrel domain-containing protein [Thermophilibacter immobilis]QOY60730.1 hypothetical protein INP52_00435 [Thermophilibacter immobilis]
MKRKHVQKVARGGVGLSLALSLVANVVLPTAALAAKSPGIADVGTQSVGGSLTSVEGVTQDDTDANVVYVTFNDGIMGKITFLEDGIFRYNVDPSGAFSEYATPRQASQTARIQQYPDKSDEYSHPATSIANAGDAFTVSAGDTTISFDKDTALMSVSVGDKTVMSESAPLSLSAGSTVQTLTENNGENFFGGGTQNGRFVHTGNSINIANEASWVDEGVSSPNPFYWTSNGYGVLRNTFQDGTYDFGKTSSGAVTTTHKENELDAYYFVTSDTGSSAVTQDMLQDFYKVTGNPVLLPEYAFYLGHLNAYNRDSWSTDNSSGGKAWTIKEGEPSTSAGTTTYEKNMQGDAPVASGLSIETLNGHGPTVSGDKLEGVNFSREFSAQAVIDRYADNDMPLGWFLPNDGYGAGYGQNGYFMTGGVNADGTSSSERLAAVAANVDNLAEFTDYANKHGVSTGLWTQSYLVPDSNSGTMWQRLRDFDAEVKVGGVTTLKTDVAWVGAGYSMELSGVKQAYDIVTTGVNARPNIITLCGWAGTQRFGAIWTGDQTGGNWEYIRFHIPTYIGQSLAGNPNIGSDMDGIFGGSALIATRDQEWKTFTPLMLDMA